MENTSHFLFKCPKFNAFRRELLLTVSNYVEPSEAVLLLGDDTLSDEGNEVITGQFINIYNKPNDFHQIIRFLDLTWKLYVTVINKRTY